MRSLVFLTVANVRSFVRDRAALFWTILFPVIFIVLFGVIFSGGDSGYNLGVADQDNTATSTGAPDVHPGRAVPDPGSRVGDRQSDRQRPARPPAGHRVEG